MSSQRGLQSPGYCSATSFLGKFYCWVKKFFKVIQIMAFSDMLQKSHGAWKQPCSCISCNICEALFYISNVFGVSLFQAASGHSLRMYQLGRCVGKHSVDRGDLQANTVQTEGSEHIVDRGDLYFNTVQTEEICRLTQCGQDS